VNGVVSLLAEGRAAQVEALWAELAARFGVRGVYVTPYPHFSYHVSRLYDPERLLPALGRLASASSPFRVRTTGLAAFAGEQPVLFIALEKSEPLSRFQRKVWEAAEAASSGSVAYYDPAHWVPHITVGEKDLTAANLPRILSHLAGRSFAWELTVSDLGVILDTPDGQKLQHRFTLTG
jgi:hypothetical protein